MAIHAYRFGADVLKALGINDSEVSRVLIDIDVNNDEGVKVYTTRFFTRGEEGPLIAALQPLAGQVDVQDADDAFVQQLIDEAQRGKQ